MRSRIRSFLLLVLLGAILLEALLQAFPSLFLAVRRAYPQVGLDEEGRVVYYDVRFERGPNGTMLPVYSLDESRNDPETVRLGPDEAIARLVFQSPGWGTSASYVPFDHPRFLREMRAVEDRFVPYTPLKVLSNTLNAAEKRRRLLPDEMWTASGELRKPPVEWDVEDDRLVCRETASGRAVASLGPDGYARDEHANEGERFGRIEVGPIRVTVGASRLSEWIPQFLLDRDAREIYVISIAKEEGSVPEESVRPVTLTIETRPLHPFQPGGGGLTARPYASIVNRNVLVFLEDGSVIADLEMGPDESVAGFSNAMVVQARGEPSVNVIPGQRRQTPPLVVGMQTSLLRVGSADSKHRRFRLFRPGQPALVRDVVLEPTRASEVILANVAAALALLRPPPLNVASSLSSLPKERWWWRDPWLANGSYPGWLVLSLALAALLAWRARRAARERCATVREVRLWTAAVFLLGPVGLLWMRLVLPRVPVEPVGNARRAANLDASPSTSEPWPEPQPQGIEVFQ